MRMHIKIAALRKEPFNLIKENHTCNLNKKKFSKCNDLKKYSSEVPHNIPENKNSDMC